MTRRIRAAPGRITSAMAQMPFLRTDDPQINTERAVQVVGVTDSARKRADRYRHAVLAHPDLSADLCREFRYRAAGQWNGYVPPRLDSNNHYNPSPYRARLVELVTEALKRSEQWTDDDAEFLAPVPERAVQAPWRQGPTDTFGSEGEG